MLLLLILERVAVAVARPMTPNQNQSILSMTSLKREPYNGRMALYRWEFFNNWRSSSRNAVSFWSAVTANLPPLSWGASATKIVRALESTV